MDFIKLGLVYCLKREIKLNDIIENRTIKWNNSY